jgi:hypothetical protein
MQNIKILVEILFDKDAPLAERDDAATDLGDYNEALEFLLSFASKNSEPTLLLQTCGTSIAEIWKRQGQFDDTLLRQLSKPAADEVRSAFS